MNQPAIEFSKTSFFLYNQNKKKNRAYFLIFFIIVVFIFLILNFFSEIQHNNNRNIFSQFLSWISKMTKSGDLRGAAVIMFSGSLFFLFLPLEILFLTFLRNGANPVSLLLVTISVLVVSHSINYAIGKRLDALSKILISPKKFYKLKGLLNHYGPLLIFIVNALPLSSPVLSAILGSFRYRKIRFYLYTISGQIILYFSLILIHLYLLKPGYNL